jgi:hypothetical protein
MNASGPSDTSPADDAVSMNKIVSLCKRRGFIFPSSEIYCGLGSTYDSGHCGVLQGKYGSLLSVRNT